MILILIAALVASAQGLTHTACEDGNFAISCQPNEEINVLSANYGRTDSATCPGAGTQVTNCVDTNSLVVVQAACEGQESCTVAPTSSVFSDQCPGTRKYLTATFNCVAVPVNGGWGVWSSWTRCSVHCGGGSKQRTRTCDAPAPANGGAQCTGSATEVAACGTSACADPDWMEVMTTAICAGAGDNTFNGNGNGWHFAVRKDWPHGTSTAASVKSCNEVCDLITESGTTPTDFAFNVLSKKCTLSLKVYPGYRAAEQPWPVQLDQKHERLGLKVHRYSSCNTKYANYCCCTIDNN